MTKLRPVVCAGVLIGLALAVPSIAQAATFTVTKTADDPPNGCQANDCSLREAVIAANNNQNSGVTDVISLPAGTYALTHAPIGQADSAAVTDLDITQAVRITGPGASSTMIDASPLKGEPVIQASANAASIQLVDVTITGGDAAGIQDAPGLALALTRSAVVGNNGGATGGGIDANDGARLILTDTTVSGNNADKAGGIWVRGDAAIRNSTISGNAASSEGGGILNEGGTTNITNSTIADNTAPAGAGGGLGNYGTTNLQNTIIADNTGGNCEDTGVPFTSLGNNIEDSDTCNLGAAGDKLDQDPALGPLAANGGETQTHALDGASPAVDAAGSCPPPSADQRGIPRPQGSACDMGAYELVTSKTVPTVPDCSPSGDIPLEMNVPGETPVAFHYKLDGGPTQDVQTSDETATIDNLPEGQFALEYWSETVESGEEPASEHQLATAVIDKTAPDLSVASDQGQSLYVITRGATVTVAADDPGTEPSGLTSDPSAANEPVSTNSRGAKTVEWSAVDLCDNTTTKTFDYTVLGPGLGERAVIEPLGEDVKVSVPDGAAAHASQKGADFEAVELPREIPIGTIVDARDGKARITSSKSTTETDIQDGKFVGGVFKVLQSHSENVEGLTKLRLRKGNFSNCGDGEGASAALSRRAVRRLRARARGRFRTSGRYSAATVRGTKWTVTDRCDGTLTKVKRGSVAVRDFRLQETINLTGGERYLALAEPPPPELGETATVDVLKGKVFVKLPQHGDFASVSQKGTDFVPLTSERSIPVRSILDTRKGTVALRTARNRKGEIQTGKFADGVFQVLQSRKRRAKGLTTLRMKGSAAKFRRCGKAGSASARAALTRRQIRRLRARARGRYRTRSRYSAATVRGTVWTVIDRCDGTLTKVKRGKVAVRDFRRKRTITVTAGKRYLASP